MFFGYDCDFGAPKDWMSRARISGVFSLQERTVNLSLSGFVLLQVPVFGNPGNYHPSFKANVRSYSEEKIVLEGPILQGIMVKFPQKDLTFPKDPWTLQRTGLNLYSRGPGSQNRHFGGVRILRFNQFRVGNYSAKMW